ncbi:MAG: hypothetical protein AAB676_04920 [Verrucomicrobiota bacterium]
MTNKLRHRVAFSTLSFIASTSQHLAHEEGAPFSGAIIDPPILHHAHIENEQRLNFFALRGVAIGNGAKRSGYAAELELAYGSKNFKYGFEVFLPVSNMPLPDGPGRAAGLGDIEVRPLKYALVMKPDFVLSTASAFGLPTGSKQDGLGSGNTSLMQLLFLDKALGNWAGGVNLGLGTNLGGERESEFEYGVGLAYSFIRGTKFGQAVPARPNQKWVLSPSIELVGRRILQGDTAGTDSVSLIPGLTFWHVPSGWQFRFGVQIPTTREREADTALIFQVGNHLNWGRLLGRKKDAPH